MNKQFIFLLSAIFSFSLASTPINVSDLYLPGIPNKSDTPSIKVEKSWLGNKKFKQLEKTNLSENTRAQILFNLENLPLNQIAKNRIIDLEIFSNNGDYQSAILRCIVTGCHKMSSFGDIALAKILTQPGPNLTIIQDRQALLRLLLNKEDVYNNVDHFSTQLKECQSNVLNFWQKENDLIEELFAAYYYSLPGSKYLNTHTTPLSVRSLSSNLSYLLTVGLVPLQLANVLRKTLSKEFIRENIMPFIKLLNFAALQHVWGQLDEKEKKIIYLLGGMLVTTLGVAVVTNKLVYDQFCQDCHIVNYMQSQLISVAQIVKIAESLIVLSEEHPEFAILPSLEKSKQLLATHNTPLSSLLDKLRTNTFAGKPSYFSINGRVRAAYMQMKQVKDGLIPLFNLVGEAEAFIAITKNIKQLNTNNNNRICFVEFINGTKPYLQLEDFWNPFVDQDIAVANSITLGDGALSQHMLLTGSNTGGKSTTLKAIMINALLAHCFGIAYASKARMSLFYLLGTSLNINDDVASGKSLFKSEVLRSKFIHNEIKALANQQFGLIIIDELFVGTSAAVGEQAAYEFAKKLALNPNVIVCFATHFPLLTKLEEEIGYYKNYKQDIYKDENSRLIRTFKLAPGFSTQNVALDILNEECS